MTKWRTLVLATAAFNLSFLVWFSFAPFTGPIADEFGLSVADIGVLASAAVWSVPVGRVVVGWLADRYGATATFAVVLAYAGVFSIASAFAQSYAVFFVERLVVASVGISFVVGIQHVSEWFPEEQLGTAEGVYAGIGNAGAAGGALLLPRLFGADWRAAFLFTGVAALAMAAVYYAIGRDAATDERRSATRESATLRSWLYTATRYGTVVLALGYAMSFGLEISMDGWLPAYFREGFGADLVLASTLAAAFSLAAGLLRPFGGFASDRLVRAERDLLPVFRGRYREQWTLACMGLVVASLVVLTAAGRTGHLPSTVLAVALVGTGCALTEGAIFAQVPSMFPNRSGAAAGVVGGIGTVGGVGFPLVFSYAATGGAIHSGYALVAALVLPVVLLNAWVARPTIARRSHVDGLVDVGVSNGEE